MVKGYKMKRYSLLAGLVLVSAQVLGMQDHSAFDGMYIGNGLAFGEMRSAGYSPFSLEDSGSSNTGETSGEFLEAACENDLETVHRHEFYNQFLESIKGANLQKMPEEEFCNKFEEIARKNDIKKLFRNEFSYRFSGGTTENIHGVAFKDEVSVHFLNAVKKNDLEIVKKFLGMDLGKIEDTVVRSNDSEALRKNLGRYVYIRTRTDINIQDKDGNTPLIWAIRNGNQEIIQLLLECKDIDLHKTDKHGNNALDWAIIKNRTDKMWNLKPAFGWIRLTTLPRLEWLISRLSFRFERDENMDCLKKKNERLSSSGSNNNKERNSGIKELAKYRVRY